MNFRRYGEKGARTFAAIRHALSFVALLAGCVACTGQRQVATQGEGAPPEPSRSEPSAPATLPAGDAEPEADVAVAAPDQEGEQTSDEQQAESVYRAELEQPLSLRQEVRHLTWTCRDGSCSARGPKLNISGKSCVSLGATLGSVVKSFEYDGQKLEGRDMEYCRSTLKRLDASGKLAAARQRQQRADSAPKGLQAGEKYIEFTAFAGQMWLRDGGLRFVFPDASVVLVTDKGGVFQFDAEQRLLEHGRFVRWHSVRGYYVSNDALSEALRERCSRTNGGIVIKPWQIYRNTFQGSSCHPHREDFRLVFSAESSLKPAEEKAARRAVYGAPYAQAHGWKASLPDKPNATVDVQVGSATTQPGYHKEPARDMLEKVQRVVKYCARYRHDPKAEMKGTLVLSLNAFGKPKVALVRRTTYPEPERMSACIEQRTMQESFQTTYDVLAQIPFRIVEQ